MVTPAPIYEIDFIFLKEGNKVKSRDEPLSLLTLVRRTPVPDWAAGLSVSADLVSVTWLKIIQSQIDPSPEAGPVNEYSVIH